MVVVNPRWDSSSFVEVVVVTAVRLFVVRVKTVELSGEGQVFDHLRDPIPVLVPDDKVLIVAEDLSIASATAFAHDIRISLVDMLLPDDYVEGFEVWVARLVYDKWIDPQLESWSRLRYN